MKEIIIIILKMFGAFTLIYLMFVGVGILGDYILESDAQASQFCEDKNYSYHRIVDNGFASSKIICLDSENNRHEYYLEEAYN